MKVCNSVRIRTKLAREQGHKTSGPKEYKRFIARDQPVFGNYLARGPELARPRRIEGTGNNRKREKWFFVCESPTDQPS